MDRVLKKLLKVLNLPSRFLHIPWACILYKYVIFHSCEVLEKLENAPSKCLKLTFEKSTHQYACFLSPLVWCVSALHAEATPVKNRNADLLDCGIPRHVRSQCHFLRRGVVHAALELTVKSVRSHLSLYRTCYWTYCLFLCVSLSSHSLSFPSPPLYICQSRPALARHELISIISNCLVPSASRHFSPAPVSSPAQCCVSGWVGGHR